MRTAIDEFFERHGEAASRAQLLEVLSRNQLDDEVARGHLVALFPRAYCRPWMADVPSVRERTALASVGQPAALSHVTGLRRWELTVPETDDVHVLTLFRRHPIGRAPGLIVHRTRVPTRVVHIDGLPTVALANAIVRSWPMLPAADRRGPAIEAVRKRLVTPAELAEVLERAVGMPGRAALGRLVMLLEAGCESELEIWGHLRVFDHPGLRHGTRQKALYVNGRAYRLDHAYEDERVAVELDGHRFHSTREQRERDMRRDADLATIDWLTLRFSHARLHHDVDGCRRQTLQTLAARRAWRRCG